MTTDTDIAREQGRQAARAARDAGCAIEPHGGDITAADWKALESALGRKVYGYGAEGTALGQAWAEGWDVEASEAPRADVGA